MKKIIVALVLSLLCVSLFAADITATAENGKKVVLHDNGTWEYVTETSVKKGDGIIGTWTYPDNAVDILVDAVLAESGIYPSNPSYTMYKSAIASQVAALPKMYLVIKDDKKGVFTSDRGTHEVEYKLNKTTRALTLTSPELGEPLIIGTFDESYSKLYIEEGQGLYLQRI